VIDGTDAGQSLRHTSPLRSAPLSACRHLIIRCHWHRSNT